VRLAVIFDMDGLMLDTERPAMLAFKRAGEDVGQPISDDLYMSTLGRNARDTEAILAAWFGAAFSYPALRARYLVHSQAHFEKHGVQVKPGLLDLLGLLETHRVPKAVATSTARERALRRLESAGILDRFSDIVCGDEIEHGKPAPGIFLKAAERLGADPADCYVLEDAEAGIRAAHAAGMMPILIPDIKQPSSEVAGLAAKSFPSLVEAKAYFEMILKG
jgi:HAD superfamily hydrolase (TIGR01509 family)